MKFCLAIAAASTLLLSPNGRAEKREEQIAGRQPSVATRVNLQNLTSLAYAGNPQAQYALGKVYEQGQGGIKKDVAYALSWYEEAARNGLKVASERLRHLNQKNR